MLVGIVVQCTSGIEVLMPAAVSLCLASAATSDAHNAPSSGVTIVYMLLSGSTGWQAAIPDSAAKLDNCG